MASIDPASIHRELEYQLQLAHQLVARLERLSADSHWARRASGYRASLLKSIEHLERARAQALVDDLPGELEWLTHLVDHGYQILDLAARELIKGRRASKPR